MSADAELRSDYIAGLIEAHEFWPTPIALLRVTGRVEWANEAGEQMLRSDPALVFADGQVNGRREPEDRALKLLLLETAAVPAAKRWASSLFRRRGGQVELAILLRRLRCAETEPLLLACLLSLTGSSPVRETPIQLGALASVFNLTAMQDRVAQALAEGLDQPAIADRYKLRIETIRGHIKGAMSRTGTASPAQLVALVSRTAAAIRL